jgi:crotonobetainyl-CoA:carnitine CoA-transferase CaiB-like acyl-CoA transferase
MSEMLFDDLLVIDCASFIAAPAAATIMADFGARVIKVEPPEHGDGYRMLRYLPGLPTGDSNYPWRATNRNKESLALDLKDPEQRAVLDKLIAKADVFITNYPLPVRKRLRLDYEDICAVNERAIYASLTPYGEEGPEAENSGYDATAWWARSGLMDHVRASGDTPPAVSVPGMGDHMASCSLYGAIVTALYRRERTGVGSKVGTSLMANGLWSNGVMVQAALDGADMSKRLDREKLSPFTQIFRCRDDRWFILTVLPQVQDQVWPRLAEVVGHPEWVQDPRFDSMEKRELNKVELTALIAPVFEQRDWAEWKALFAEHNITCGSIARTSDHGDDPQVKAAGALTELDDGGRSVNSPLYIAGVEKRAASVAPEVGQHSAAILAEFRDG